MPLLARCGDSLQLSFAAEIARQFYGGLSWRAHASQLTLQDRHGILHPVPLDGVGRLRLNHFGGRLVRQLGFVEALQLMRDRPEEIDLHDAIVFVGVVAPGIAVSKTTPLNPALPASLLQLTAVENILQKTFLTPISPALQLLLLVLLNGTIYRLLKSRKISRAAWIVPVVLVLIIAAGLLLFLRHWIWPLATPLASVATLAGALMLHTTHQQRREALERQGFLQEEIEEKTQALRLAQSQLETMQRQWGNDADRFDEAELQRFMQKQNAVTDLERRLADLRGVMRSARERATQKYDILYSEESPMAEVIRTIDMVASSDLAIILQGETGTGKELVARAIHQAGRRAAAPFLAVNCSALPETLLESELFGHEKGSFTGAVARRRGLFELADGGTLFLDEISETSPAFQSRLLRVLQEREVQRLGSEAPIRVDVRVIAASNRDLHLLVQEGIFRADLFYRLNGMTIALPALRERPMDIPVLVQHILAAADAGKPWQVEDAALVRLLDHHWPGNIRELENVLQRATLIARGNGRERIQTDDLPDALLEKKRISTADFFSLEEQILHTLRTLEFSHSAIAQTARALGGKDRGTVTEYFRGLCFAALAAQNFRVEGAARALAASTQPEVVARVQKKIWAYVNHLKSHADAPHAQAFKGLPRKYHADLQKVLDHLDLIA